MDIILPTPGTYVLAISGGVDSRVLLDVLHKRTTAKSHKYVIAHLDHGIRTDSHADSLFACELAKKYNDSFENKTINLGNNASEEQARNERYSFLKEIQKKYHATAIITAHHQDDVIETAIINLIRGSGRKGLSSLKSHDELLRPLLNVSKNELIEYAKLNKLEWHEDSTNNNESYLRNYVRKNIVSKFSEQDRQKFLDILKNAQTTNIELDNLLDNLVDEQAENKTIDRIWFNGLSHSLAKETMATWLRNNSHSNFDSKTLERLVVAAKSARAGQSFPVINNSVLRVTRDKLALELAER
ncbi:MAG: tRNA lysidine(34) synthetase TilS [Candidatus Saccharimonadales bacterium]